MPAGPTPAKAELGPPPRWLKCPRKGRVIAGRFVPFKTPLCDLYDSKVPERYRFYPKMVFSDERKIGLWIDLTNTDRFYRREETEVEECRYVKLHCRGHGESPSEEATEAFIALCRQFVIDHPRQMIAVHCTHGFNRTGFLICAYLVTEMDWSVEAAVREYAAAREPGIYKQEYINDLFSRYGDVEDAPQAPGLPAWCEEMDPVLDEHEAEGSSGPSTSNGAPKNFSGKAEAQFMDGKVPAVTAVKDISIRNKMVKFCQQMCGSTKNGFPGSQPVSMECSPTVNNLKYLSEQKYMVSWKADGARYMMLIKDKGSVFMFDRDNNCFQVPNLTFPHRKEPSRHITDTLLDGEMIIDEVDGQEIPRYLIYDIVKFEGQSVGECDFGRRTTCIKMEIIEPRNRALQTGAIRRDDEPFSIRLKDFWPVDMVEKIFADKFQKSLGHEVDGLIFQPWNMRYEVGTSHTTLKWKPPHLNSIDFKLVIRKEHKPGMLPEWVGNLHVTGIDTPFSTMKVTRALKECDKKIIEVSLDKDNGQWIFLRVRTDKSFPNHYTTAQSVMNSIRFPITKDSLVDFIKKHGYRKRTTPPPADNQDPNKKRIRVDGEPIKAQMMPPPSQNV